MANRTLKRLLYGTLGALGVALALVALYLLSRTAQNSQEFDRMYVYILLVNVAGVLVLFALMVGNLARLFRDYRAHVPGSKLKARMVAMFVGLAAVPLLVVFYFSMQFINRGIDTWFNVEVEAGLDDALALSRAALEMQMREHLESTTRIAGLLEQVSINQVIFELSSLRRQTGASEITLFGRNQQIIATSSDFAANSVPEAPSDEVVLQIQQNRPYVRLFPLEEGRYEIRTAVAVGTRNRPQISGLLRARFPVSERISRMADSVDSSYSDYKLAEYLREPLKRSFTMTLTVAPMLSLLASIYGAFVLSRRMVAPIQDLVAGTRAVAKGDFDTRLPTPSRDEIGFLVSSFNDMTQRLSTARRQASLSQAQVEAERANLEVILARLSTGVVSLESDLRIRTANQAAGAILNVDLESRVGEYLPDVARGQPLLEQFVDVARVHLNAGDREWREQIVLRGEVGRRVLTCACTMLPGDEDHDPGFVVVFDDITALLQAQRDAAWGEVARRLAHEIKNPLTPIQLSAERLRRKYLRSMAADEAQVLDRATHTIVQQVEAMKEMVNAFSEYARAPDLDINRFSAGRLAHEVVDLYRAQESGVEIVLHAADALPDIEADMGRVRQILHNLIRNATEALEHGKNGRIDVTVDAAAYLGVDVIEITVADNGPGFNVGSLSQVFDPYVTTKPKGTGLGLAIGQEAGGGARGHDRGREPRTGAPSFAYDCRVNRIRARSVDRDDAGTRRKTEGKSMSTSHVLVVDDEADIRALISEILTDEGYEVTVAQDAAAAREARANARFDLVLLDIWMPDTDGISLLREWSEQASSGTAPSSSCPGMAPWTRPWRRRVSALSTSSRNRCRSRSCCARSSERWTPHAARPARHDTCCRRCSHPSVAAG
ncbi:MAG: HAMP domain-containing protein [Woeseiaceae bacterium]|nr:HAMP domain-containing protein [Woeseiaceae bacterium]